MPVTDKFAWGLAIALALETSFHVVLLMRHDFRDAWVKRFLTPLTAVMAVVAATMPAGLSQLYSVSVGLDRPGLADVLFGRPPVEPVAVVMLWAILGGVSLMIALSVKAVRQDRTWRNRRPFSS